MKRDRGGRGRLLYQRCIWRSRSICRSVRSSLGGGQDSRVKTTRRERLGWEESLAKLSVGKRFGGGRTDSGASLACLVVFSPLHASLFEARAGILILTAAPYDEHRPRVIDHSISPDMGLAARPWTILLHDITQMLSTRNLNTALNMAEGSLTEADDEQHTSSAGRGPVIWKCKTLPWRMACS